MTKQSPDLLLELLMYVFLCAASPSLAFILSPIPLERGFAKIPFVSADKLASFEIPPENQQRMIETLCSQLHERFRTYSWQQPPCEGVSWNAHFQTGQQHPLLYASFGEGKETTLILSGVHPDEITPIHLAFRFARHLKRTPEIFEGNGIRIVVAPLVNPDGFLLEHPTRTNAHGIDVNRNFLTRDWYEKALGSWVGKNDARGRYFPGYFPNTEIETFFQVWLIQNFQPSKILSIHAPLGFYDYDGPGDEHTEPLTPGAEKGKQLVRKVAEKSRNYRIVDYSFYPGSLGNFAGNERKVPTLTLELETTNPSRVEDYWQKFLPGFIHSVQFPYLQGETVLDEPLSVHP
ncbi:MAG: hypothetical protein HYW48_05750 [Deltaproteobacteria bacterium]|nr:hypothetical protein [Deltaproteobacteria bacterium]